MTGISPVSTYDIAIDVQGLQSEASRNRGIGRYVQASLPRLLTRLVASGARCRLYGSSLLSQPYFPGIENYPLTLLPFQENQRGINEALYRAQLLAHPPDLLLLPSPVEHEAFLPDFSRAPFRVASICYDLIPYIFAEVYLANDRTRRDFAKRLHNIAGADCVLAISEATRQDTMRIFGKSEHQVFNVSAGVPEFFRPLTPAEKTQWQTQLSAKFNLNRPWIMYTGGDEWRKNIDGLISGFAGLPKSFRQQYHLVIACKISKERIAHFAHLAEQQGLAPGEVIFTNFVTDEELRAFYALCSLFVFPSLYEGFGLPVVEAMACGAPVVVADNSSLAEIVPDARQRFDPKSASSFQTCLTDTLSDKALLERLRDAAPREATRFNWETVADRMFEALGEKAVRPPESFTLDRLPSVEPETTVAVRPVQAASVPSSTRPLLAYFSPLPPLESGISDYSAELLPYLSKYFDIDLFIDKGYTPNLTDYPVLRAATWEMKQRHGKIGYLAPLYQMGNSDMHTYIFHQLQRYAGITTLHDYALHGMINYASTWQKHLGISLHEELVFHLGPVRGKEAIQDLLSGRIQVHELPKHDIWLNRRIFTRSLGVIVHSKTVYAQALREHGDDCEFISVIPQAMASVSVPTPDGIRNLRQKWNIPQDAFVFGSFGFVAASKRPLPLLEAFAQHRQTHPNAHLLFGGGISGDIPLQDEITRLGLKGFVHNTGFVQTVQEFEELVRLSDVGVALRYPSHGETSAALLRLLAQHKPCIVTDIGSFQDYADTVVHKVPPPTEVDEVSSIVQALAVLQDNPTYRIDLAREAGRLVQQEHNPARVAQLYADFIAAVMQSPRTRLRLLGDRIGRDLSAATLSDKQLQQAVDLFQPLFTSAAAMPNAEPKQRQ